MKHLCKRRTLVAGAALMAAGLMAPAQAEAHWDIFGHHSHYAHADYYAAPTYYYVPMVVAPYYQAPVQAVPAKPAQPAKKEEAKEEKAESKAQPTVSPTYLYSNTVYATPNPVVMVYPPLVYGFGQPVIMW